MHACIYEFFVYFFSARNKVRGEKKKLNKSLVDIEDALKRGEAAERCDDRVVSFSQTYRCGEYVYNIL
jgi:hypothetical protein